MHVPVRKEVLAFALDAWAGERRQALEDMLESLVASKVLFYRRHAGEYRIWEGSDLDLRALIRQKSEGIVAGLDVGEVIKAWVQAPVLTPYRYNNEFKIARSFVGEYVSARAFERAVQEHQGGEPLRDVDARVYYVLAETQLEVELAVELAKRLTHEQLVVVIPRRPLEVGHLVAELVAIHELLRDASVVGQDPVVRRELSELADDALVALRRKLACFQNPRSGWARWWYRGKEETGIRDGWTLRQHLSKWCESLYPATPRLNSELINRREPSAVTVNARKKVLRALMEGCGKPALGLEGHGPDVSIFRAVYLRTGLYRQGEAGAWRIAQPEECVDKNLSRVLEKIHDFFRRTQEEPKTFDCLVKDLIAPPYGIRDGVLPLLFAIAFKQFPVPLSLFVGGVYVKELKAEVFEQMVLTPDRVLVQCVSLPEHVRKYLQDIEKCFRIGSSFGPRLAEAPMDPLRGSLEALYRWVHALPPCTLATERLSGLACKFRKLLQTATDPVALLFVDLPRLLVGVPEANGPWADRATCESVVKQLADLRKEIEGVYEGYLHAVAQMTRAIFKLSQGGVEGLGEALRAWRNTCVPELDRYVEDPQAQGLLERLGISYETDARLTESLAALVTGRAVSHWDDSFLRRYEIGLLALWEKLVRANALLVKKAGAGPSVRDRIRDPVLWERLERLDDGQRELLAYHLITTGRGGEVPVG